MGLNDLLKDVQVLAIVCNQYGDTGKGKFSDYFSAHWADVCARGTGGNNAGHTVVVNGHEKIFHLLPCGIVHDSNGRVNVLGNGMVIDVGVLCEELDLLDSEGLSYDNLMISEDAHVIMPYHIRKDKRENQSQKNGGIGSTGMGIGPCYEDKVARRGIRIRDLFDTDNLKKSISKNLKNHYKEENDLNAEDIASNLKPLTERIQPFVRDTIFEMHKFKDSGKRILLEGAQGFLLSVDHGTYPYVTGSDCSLDGTAKGAGLPARAVDRCFGIVKFPFMTRVGGGPFTTELGGRKSEEYCGKGGEHDIFYEVKEHLGMNLDLNEIRKLQGERNLEKLAEYKKQALAYIKLNQLKIIELINSPDPFMQGIGIRLATLEYGATTARPRRIGWTDCVALNYAVKHNGPLLIFTKADSIAGADEFNICYSYKNDLGVDNEFSRDEKKSRGFCAKYETYEGYGNIREIRKFDSLPTTLLKSISDIQDFTKSQVVAISVGPEREATIVR